MLPPPVFFRNQSPPKGRESFYEKFKKGGLDHTCSTQQSAGAVHSFADRRADCGLDKIRLPFHRSEVCAACRRLQYRDGCAGGAGDPYGGKRQGKATGTFRRTSAGLRHEKRTRTENLPQRAPSACRRIREEIDFSWFFLHSGSAAASVRKPKSVFKPSFPCLGFRVGPSGTSGSAPLLPLGLLLVPNPH